MSKVWFITGVSTGFGRILAEKVAKRGDIVIGTLRNSNQISDFEKLVPGKVFGKILDVTNEKDVHSVVNQCVEQFGKIDVAVNNAGYGLFGAVEETSFEEAKAQMDTNFYGALFVTQAVLPFMREKKSGTILQISSVAGFRSNMGLGLYNASKFALEGFSEALAQECKPLGIRVCLIEPGPFRTDWAGRSAKRTEKEIKDYSSTAGLTIKLLNRANGKQEGDPEKACDVMIQVVDSENPPVHLPLGKIALEGFKAKIKSVQEDIAAWEAVSLKTSFDS